MKIYDIHSRIQVIMNIMFDKETGEINQEALDKLNKLNMDKDKAIENMALECINQRADRAGLKSEIERLKTLIKQSETKEQYLTETIGKHIDKDETIKGKVYEIKWTKSESVGFADDFDINDLPENLIRTKIEPDKVGIKQQLKAIGALPGCHLKYDERIKIK